MPQAQPLGKRNNELANDMTTGQIGKEERARFDASSRRFLELYKPLIKDVHTAFKRADEDPTAFNRRSTFRAVFSAIEGIIWLVKDQLIVGLHTEDGLYSRAETALLFEESYQLDERGNAVTRQRFLRVSQNLLFAWRMYFRDVLPEFSRILAGTGGAPLSPH